MCCSVIRIMEKTVRGILPVSSALCDLYTVKSKYCYLRIVLLSRIIRGTTQTLRRCFLTLCWLFANGRIRPYQIIVLWCISDQQIVSTHIYIYIN